MLRVNQTQALSSKVARLFESIAPKANLQSRTVLVGVENPTRTQDSRAPKPVIYARRRRQRRQRVVRTAGNIRSSWF